LRSCCLAPTTAVGATNCPVAIWVCAPGAPFAPADNVTMEANAPYLKAVNSRRIIIAASPSAADVTPANVSGSPAATLVRRR
jgi:hypothetical protein